MKKFLLAIVVVMMASSLSAQDLQKNIYGVRAGLNISTMSLSGGGDDYNTSAKSKTSFHVGFDYQRLLMQSLPLYLETGLYYSNKGYKYGEDSGWLDDGEVQHNLLIPAMIGYHVQLPCNFILQPAVGVYYSYSLATVGYMDAGSDFGLKIGVGATWKSIYLGVGYELGFLNLGYDDLKAKNRNFMVSVGYNFKL
ncbi:MAG: porin family protein [Alistipes sp.]|uniref:outer membrane beta-barrel protein n=1 Tax=Alistipes sp. TaxID=1872444 RepID=UPI0025BE9776|nr:outer membrane beta-barrel protein [Alistipes sp.]MCD8275111.1 porin family protein [Alistipes sp.]